MKMKDYESTIRIKIAKTRISHNLCILGLSHNENKWLPCNLKRHVQASVVKYVLLKNNRKFDSV